MDAWRVILGWPVDQPTTDTNASVEPLNATTSGQLEKRLFDYAERVKGMRSLPLPDLLFGVFFWLLVLINSHGSL